MGLFARFKRVVKSNINQILNKTEDPAKMLNQILQEMTEQLYSAKKSIATAIADGKLLERRIQENRNNADEWEKRAILALQAADQYPDQKEYYENLARQALSKQKDYEVTAQNYEEQFTLQQQSVEELKGKLQELQSRIEDAHRKKNLLIARARRAETQKKIQEHLEGLPDISAFQAFEELSAKIEHLEAETEASAKISIKSGRTLEDEFNLLENSNKGDQAIADLRKKISNSSTKRTSDTETAQVDPDIDLKLENLKKRIEN